MIKMVQGFYKSRNFWLVIVLFALILFNVLFTKGFGNIEIKQGRLYGSIIDIFYHGSLVMILAVGMTLVIASGCIDLSVGAVMAITGAFAAVLITQTGLPISLVLGLSLIVATTAGLWNGFLVGYLKIQPFVATLILMIGGRGVAQLLTDGKTINFHDSTLEFIGRGNLLGIPISIVVALIIASVTYFIIRTTVAGLYVEAVGDNERASRLSGVNPALVKLLAFAFLGLCAGLAGILYTSNLMYAESFQCGLYKELDAILAVVIGGTLLSGGRANLVGSVIGALIMETLTIMLLMRGVVFEHTLVVKAGAVIIVCLIQSSRFHEILSRMFVKRSVT